MYYAKTNLPPYIRNRVTLNFFLLYNVATFPTPLNSTYQVLSSKHYQLNSYILSSFVYSRSRRSFV